jgi:hypothetical protein
VTEGGSPRGGSLDEEVTWSGGPGPFGEVGFETPEPREPSSESPIRPPAATVVAAGVVVPAPLWRISLMSLEKPWNDVPDQLRPVEPEPEVVDEEAAVGRAQADPEPPEVPEADPADVADQNRVVPLPDDGPEGTW